MRAKNVAVTNLRTSLRSELAMKCPIGTYLNTNSLDIYEDYSDNQSVQ